MTEQTYDTQAKINQFLYEFISRGSSVDIFTERLSWVASDQGMRKLLLDKARTERVTIFMHSRNPIAHDLEENGVRIIYYSKLIGEVPTRFTLLNRGEPGSQALAIGTGVLPDFRISVYKDAEHPMVIGAFNILIAILEKSIRPNWQEWLRSIAAFSGIVGLSLAVSIGRLGLETALGLGLGVGAIVVLVLLMIARLRGSRVVLHGYRRRRRVD